MLDKGCAGIQLEGLRWSSYLDSETQAVHPSQLKGDEDGGTQGPGEIQDRESSHIHFVCSDPPGFFLSIRKAEFKKLKRKRKLSSSDLYSSGYKIF